MKMKLPKSSTPRVLSTSRLVYSDAAAISSRRRYISRELFSYAVVVDFGGPPRQN